MIDKTKYLYWLNDENEELETVWREMHSLVGSIVYLSQMIEYNIANVIANLDSMKEVGDRDSIIKDEWDKIREKNIKRYDVINARPLGQIKEEMKKYDYFSDEFIEEVENVNEARKLIVHNKFKQVLFSKEFDNLDNVEKYIEYLNKEQIRFADLNEKVLDMFGDTKHMSLIIE